MGKFCLEIQIFLEVFYVVTYASGFMVVLRKTGGLLLQSPFILGYVHHFSCSSLSLYLLFLSLLSYNLQFSVHSLDHCSPSMAATSIRRKLVVREWIM